MMPPETSSIPAAASHPRWNMLFFILLPVLIVPLLVMLLLLVRGNRAEQLYDRALAAAAAGDMAAAAVDFEKAGALGHAESSYNLALIYRSGAIEAGNNEELYLTYLTRAALNGSLIAEFELGVWAENQPEADYPLAALHYRRAALGGLNEGLMALGRCYENGLGVNKSALLAREFYRKAARQNHAAAERALGMLYLSGALGEADAALAEKYLRKAAETGNGQAFTALGYIYEHCRPDLDPEQADKLSGEWYRRGAEAADPEGIVNYGDFLLKHGHSEDAVKWFSLAADKFGFAPANHRLGIYYFKQTEPDYNLARTYFERAAAAGNSASWINLGIIAECGLDNNMPDRQRAVECYEMAEKLGHSDAADYLRKISAQ